jgi:hypothetical protein
MYKNIFPLGGEEVTRFDVIIKVGEKRKTQNIRG